MAVNWLELIAKGQGKTIEGFDTTDGLCNNLLFELEYFVRTSGNRTFDMHKAFEEWPLFSGEPEFPVMEKGKRPTDSFMDRKLVKDMYGNDEYGTKRKQLAAHCAQWLKENYL